MFVLSLGNLRGSQGTRRSGRRGKSRDRLSIRPATIWGHIWLVFFGGRCPCQEGYLVTHRDPFFIDIIRDHLNLSAKGFRARGGTQLRLKISSIRDIETVENMILPHGWKPRKKKERPYPSGSIDDRGFVRAWVELHSTDFRRPAKRNTGNTGLGFSATGTSSKTQPTTNSK